MCSCVCSGLEDGTHYGLLLVYPLLSLLVRDECVCVCVCVCVHAVIIFLTIQVWTILSSYWLALTVWWAQYQNVVVLSVILLLLLLLLLIGWTLPQNSAGEKCMLAIMIIVNNCCILMWFVLMYALGFTSHYVIVLAVLMLHVKLNQPLKDEDCL